MLARLLDTAGSDMVHLLDSQPTHQDATGTEQIADELDAIGAIVEVLERLPDTSARARVLRWAAERLEIQTTATAAVPASIAAAANAFDPTLSVDGLQDLFPAATAKDMHAQLSLDDTLATDVLTEAVPAIERPASAGAETARADSLIHSFV